MIEGDIVFRTREKTIEQLGIECKTSGKLFIIWEHAGKTAIVEQSTFALLSPPSTASSAHKEFYCLFIP
jgi:hypothetical protein